MPLIVGTCVAVLGTARAGEGGESAPRGSITLKEAITKALTYDPTVRKIFADVIQADGFAKEMRADMRPQVFLEASAGGERRDRSSDGLAASDEWLFSRSASLVARQLIWSKGYFSNRYKDAQQRREASLMLEKEQRELTAYAVTGVFLDIIHARRQIVYAENNVSEHSRVLGLAKERAEAAGTQADVDLSDARYNLALNLVRERRLALKQAEAKYVRLVGEQVPNSLAMPRVPTVKSFDSLDFHQNWHYLATLHQSSAAALQKEALKGKYAPRFYLEGRGTVGQDVDGIKGRDNSASAMIVMSWDLFDGGRRKAEIQQASADIERQEAITQEVLDTLRQDAAAHWADYTSAGYRLDLLRKYSKSLKGTVGLYREQFDLGTRPLLSMLDIQNEVTSANIRIADEERDQAKLGYSLLYFTSGLITYAAGAEQIATPREPDGSTPVPGRPMGDRVPEPVELAHARSLGQRPSK
ncbi:TolC family protein [Roseimicrobium sp. ORNL1]|uniref:TolC family protein n=1 Tax=Roseimicrobium sp. ORNL1 TaxID=2711231 RepID=UPI0013E12382|nr:TolC family protein [Roseimicrobium sp. ORNL1]QIF02304.1 TolC family protein [Roseimicrobium sp. ORNL1]